MPPPTTATASGPTEVSAFITCSASLSLTLIQSAMLTTGCLGADLKLFTWRKDEAPFAEQLASGIGPDVYAVYGVMSIVVRPPLEVEMDFRYSNANSGVEPSQPP